MRKKVLFQHLLLSIQFLYKTKVSVKIFLPYIFFFQFYQYISFCQMNFENLLHETSINNDFQRLVQLCSSFGLNEQETNQIISDFKNGSFAQQDQSVDQSFHQSLRDLDSHSESVSRVQHEEYSFKNRKNIQNLDNNRHLTSNNDSLEQQQVIKSNRNKKCQINNEMLECFINERREFERNIYGKLQQENQSLRNQLKQKQEKISAFIKMKMQDTQIILGLKETLSNMSNIMKEKDRAYQNLFDKYEKMKMDNETVASQKSSKASIIHQQSMQSFQQRKSIVKQKKNCVTESDQNKICKKSSQKYIRQIGREGNKTTDRAMTLLNQQNRQNLPRNDQTKRTGVDINKYKGMIEKLRNSYELR